MTDTYSAENQTILRQLVDREVFYNVSMMVSHFAQNEAAIDGSNYDYEDVLDLCQGQDWESAWDESGAIVLEDEDGDWYAIPEKYKHHVEDETDEEERQSSIIGYGEPVDDPEDYKELCEVLDIDPHEREAYEHWIVSDWLADKLREKGEIVGELFGLTIWGRCTTGQAILLDGVIGEIANEMQILKGQANDWSK